MTAVTALRRGRAAALTQMVDACVISRPGSPVTDPDTGEVTTPMVQMYPDPAWPEEHPWRAGPCKVQTYEPQETVLEIGTAVMTRQRYQVQIPAESYPAMLGDVIEITAAALDQQLVGRRYRVVALLHKTMATAYRLGVEEH